MLSPSRLPSTLFLNFVIMIDLMNENEWFKHLETLLIRQKKISQVLKDKELEKMNKNWNIADLISETDFCGWDICQITESVLISLKGHVSVI